MAETIKLTEIANFVDMESPYLKMALSYFAPELMEPYKEWDIEDNSLNEKSFSLIQKKPGNSLLSQLTVHTLKIWQNRHPMHVK